jgi:predicted alpha/beta hydrolase family esterase
MATLERELVAAPEPVVLAAHSLACALVAHLAQRFDHASPKIRAALLVAPADVDAEAHTPPQTRSFAPMPMLPLPFASILVASRDDPYVTFERATAFARAWGSQLFDAGAAGHINAASGFGAWPSGRALLDQLIARTS